MLFYGHEYFFNKDCRGCCPTHDTIYYPWGTRTSNLRSRLKRIPKKIERQRIREELNKIKFEEL